MACRKGDLTTTVTPDEFYRSSLFRDVQLAAVFPDSKTFPDCRPKRPLAELLLDYDRIKSAADFDIAEFVRANFEPPIRPNSDFETDSRASLDDHITRLWTVLTRPPDDAQAGSSLIPLKRPYIVPGGRFSEIYYWDSYFTLLGLKAQGKNEMVRNMVGNFAFLIDSLGFIPNGNRNYYLTRSQPPFFSLMVSLLEEGDDQAAVQFLPQLQREYAFWMRGEQALTNPGDAVEHVVMLPDGSVLNRYFDRGDTPRPEAFKEDFHLTRKTTKEPALLYRDLRSAAESGWDFSSRWLNQGAGLERINTTAIIPVDLNCLLYHHEMMLAKGLRLSGDSTSAQRMAARAEERKNAIIRYGWDEAAGFFGDFDFTTRTPTGVKSLAGVYPLFFGLASTDQARKATVVLEAEFLQPGGLVTTLTDTGEQWDSPNGWAPLQWMAYKGLMNYQYEDLAAEVRGRWLRQNERVFLATGKMMEKYNVMDTTLAAGGGEYPNQDGFGWTNGVALALMAEEQAGH